MARTTVGGRVVCEIGRRVPFVVPGRVHTGENVLVFKHPVPSAPGHLVAIPRKYVRDACSSSSPAHTFWDQLEAWILAQPTASRPKTGITNLGRRQEVGLLHVHLLDALPRWWPTDHPPDLSPTLRNAMMRTEELLGERDRPDFEASIAFTPPSRLRPHWPVVVDAAS